VKKEKSVASVVSTHILTTSIVIPFFGLLAGYFVNKFLGASLNEGLVMIIKDIVYVTFFFMGVKYSISYINKKITVKNPQNSLKYSIITFGVIIIFMLIVDILAKPNIISIGYNTAFFGIIFTIFFILTKNYFEKLQQKVQAVEA
jgi:hypothetical protein